MRMIESRRMRGWREREMDTEYWSENLMGRDHSEDIGIDGTIIL
jgi:hypothetical protein